MARQSVGWRLGEKSQDLPGLADLPQLLAEASTLTRLSDLQGPDAESFQNTAHVALQILTKADQPFTCANKRSDSI